MRFMTPVELKTPDFTIDHNTPALMVGSCFTDNIGSRLSNDGFNVSVNPMGVLFNPASISGALRRALDGTPYTADDLVEYDGVWHCLDFASRRQGQDPHKLLSSLNDDFREFAAKAREAKVWIVTFGTAWVFDRADNHHTVGNCHKLPMDFFVRRRLDVSEIVDTWKGLCHDRHVIFTVSPVRHLADGMHGNSLSKATLMLAIDNLCRDCGAEYFPAFEIVNDQLRDYRFYAADMKHPSDVAVDFIYDRFASVYFTPDTRLKALEFRNDFLRRNHRPIL